MHLFHSGTGGTCFGEMEFRDGEPITKYRAEELLQKFKELMEVVNYLSILGVGEETSNLSTAINYYAEYLETKDEAYMKAIIKHVKESHKKCPWHIKTAEENDNDMEIRIKQNRMPQKL